MDHEWLFGDDVGLSAQTIWRTMYGTPEPDRWGGAYPHDPYDLGRCIRLLRRHPEWVERMPEMARHNRVWAVMADRWTELVASYEEEEPSLGCRYGWSAPKTYALMKEITDSDQTTRNREG